MTTEKKIPTHVPMSHRELALSVQDGRAFHGMAWVQLDDGRILRTGGGFGPHRCGTDALHTCLDDGGT